MTCPIPKLLPSRARPMPVAIVRCRDVSDRWRSIEAMRRTGRMMIAVGLVGALGAVLSWHRTTWASSVTIR